jgi:hypothetical protein
MISYIFNAIINDYVRDRVKLKVPVIRVLCTAVRTNVQFGVQQSEPMFSVISLQYVPKSTAQLHLASCFYKDLFLYHIYMIMNKVFKRDFHF